MTPPAWQPCRFDAEGQLLEPSVHDNFVLRLEVDLEARTLILHTEYRDREPTERTSLRFTGVVAHHFDDVTAPSILLDVARAPARAVLERWAALFASRQHHGWPLIGVPLSELPARLDAEGAQGYLVMGSCGLDGFVLASSLEHLGSGAEELGAT